MKPSRFTARQVLLAVLSVLTGTCAAGISKPAYDTLIAHRGESVDAPENTLPAYKTAVERGFGFECDIYLSKDGRVFTFHDRNLKRVTEGANTNKCSDVTWAEIEKVDVGNWGKWKNSKFKGTRPALLEEVLALARDGRRIYIEVKTGPEIVPYVKKVFETQATATPGNVLFIAFNRKTCKALKRLMPEYKVYLLTYATTRWGENEPPVTAKFLLEGLKETGADGVDCMYKPETVTSELVKAVRDAGYEFHVWTVDNLADTLEAFRRGVQTVTTNCARKQLEEYKTQTVFAYAPVPIVFDTPATDEKGVMALGNGEVGATAWLDAAGTLHTVLQNSDSWNEGGRHVKTGAIDYETKSPVDAGTYRQELSLERGELKDLVVTPAARRADVVFANQRW